MLCENMRRLFHDSRLRVSECHGINCQIACSPERMGFPPASGIGFSPCVITGVVPKGFTVLYLEMFF